MDQGRGWTVAVGSPCLHPLLCSFNLWQRARVPLAALSSPSLDKRHFIRAKACRCSSRPLNTRPLWVSLTERLIGEVVSEVTWPFCSKTERPDAHTPLSLRDYSLIVTSGTDQTALLTYRACLESRFVLIHSHIQTACAQCALRYSSVFPHSPSHLIYWWQGPTYKAGAIRWLYFFLVDKCNM